ncbi:GNAT family N-acetyltransferase [Stakelama sp. CBK3Z-3]|uniref:GNAT family N-acetyltransferase n=1 Tax=Stakelama flava TaxID=2860338 RepID=A0ABS6XL58_9SPHN|nr:GNAT family N-acetyltransferase [Stakelama flava]MBW4330948.1 GNAT family N-acetyltransferase [Stakelama flava]
MVEKPRISIKLLGDCDTLRRLLPSNWQVAQQMYAMMRHGDAVDPTPIPPEYHLDATDGNQGVAAFIFDSKELLAASGYAVEHAGLFVYDRIITEPDYRRRGLGRHIMAALDNRRFSTESQRFLVASAEGKALYESIGWSVVAPYSSAVIPGV